MTVTYTAKVAKVQFKTLWRLLKRWRGSVYKNVWKDALLFLTLYFSLSIVYRLALTESQRRTFEKIVLYCQEQSTNIPVAFVLGFYVTIVVNRWWQQTNDYMPWPDNFAIAVTAFVHGNDDRGRLMRRTLVRYINLSWILALCSISTIAKKRFPTLDHLVEIGMMTKNEQEIFENIKTNSNKYYIPLVWATALLSRAKKEDRIHTDYAKAHLVKLITDFRSMLGTLFNYDWLSVPLVYTQVVTIAVQSYFLANVIGSQFIDPNQNYPGKSVDIYIPVFLLLEFLFYMGWLKVAEGLLNPFGEDDDDFDTNWVMDRNIQVCYLIVDDMHSEYPELIKDAYWDTVDFSLPYTAAAGVYKVEPYLGSTNEIELKEDEVVFLPMQTLQEEENAENPDDPECAPSAVTPSNLKSNTIKSSLQKLLSSILGPFQALSSSHRSTSTAKEGDQQHATNITAPSNTFLGAGRYDIPHNVTDVENIYVHVKPQQNIPASQSQSDDPKNRQLNVSRSHNNNILCDEERVNDDIDDINRIVQSQTCPVLDSISSKQDKKGKLIHVRSDSKRHNQLQSDIARFSEIEKMFNEAVQLYKEICAIEKQFAGTVKKGRKKL